MAASDTEKLKKPRTGLFITFEGIDGSGKSTQGRDAAGYLKGLRLPVVSIREPGSAKLSEKIRSALLDPKLQIDAYPELLLYLAARGQLVADIIIPALEENKIVYDIKKGDVIFHDRWLFHRTVTVAEYEKQFNNDLGESLKLERSGKIFRRYSIRYSPGSARVPPGYGVEPSVLYNAANANRTLDEIVESDGPWYPEVWPRLKENDETDNIDGLVDLVHEKMPQAEIARDERKKEIRMALKKGGQ